MSRRPRAVAQPLRRFHPGWLIALIVFALIVLAAAILSGAEPAAKKEAPKDAPPANAKWIELFDGKTLDGWEKTNFGGEGEVEVKDGQIVMEMGGPMTGVTYKGKQKLPTMDYELVVVAARLDGDDFFAGTTFPVNDSHCSFINGGWGGTVTGLSNIDDQDAFRNATTQYIDYKKGQWYEFRVRITKEKIQAWIDNKQVVDQEIKGKKIGIRDEVEKSKPFGISAYQVKAAVKTVKIRTLDEKK